MLECWVAPRNRRCSHGSTNQSPGIDYGNHLLDHREGAVPSPSGSQKAATGKEKSETGTRTAKSKIVADKVPHTHRP